MIDHRIWPDPTAGSAENDSDIIILFRSLKLLANSGRRDSSGVMQP
jgi:hypothetical protein